MFWRYKSTGIQTQTSRARLTAPSIVSLCNRLTFHLRPPDEEMGETREEVLNEHVANSSFGDHVSRIDTPSARRVTLSTYRDTGSTPPTRRSTLSVLQPRGERNDAFHDTSWWCLVLLKNWTYTFFFF